MGGGFVFFVVVGDGDEGLGADGGLLTRDGYHEVGAIWDELFFVEGVEEGYIAHSETDGGGWWASHKFNQVVVASASNEGAVAVGDGFEDGACVVGESSGDVEVGCDPVGVACGCGVDGAELVGTGF